MGKKLNGTGGHKNPIQQLLPLAGVCALKSQKPSSQSCWTSTLKYQDNLYNCISRHLVLGISNSFYINYACNMAKIWKLLQHISLQGINDDILFTAEYLAAQSCYHKRLSWFIIHSVMNLINRESNHTKTSQLFKSDTNLHKCTHTGLTFQL